MNYLNIGLFLIPNFTNPTQEPQRWDNSIKIKNGKVIITSLILFALKMISSRRRLTENKRKRKKEMYKK
jgi:hypothetical protein